MAVTLQKKLELAGDLAKVQPLLQRLRIVEKPKERHGTRNVILASSVIGFFAFVLAAVAVRRRGRPLDDAVTGEDDLQADPVIEEALPTIG